ncbi:hypothetical protein EVAR_96891_1 [Eumeta japonica]|uniref:Uncharacterized protein n=1 Tax=Eumeta variegata TaxID=151549 RepID=A0A4C1WDC4_EUMVA|nr:hypothetical protein EVAR_96891_1 [Eumeta japonica]
MFADQTSSGVLSSQLGWGAPINSCLWTASKDASRIFVDPIRCYSIFLFLCSFSSLKTDNETRQQRMKIPCNYRIRRRRTSSPFKTRGIGRPLTAALLSRA